MANNTAPAVPAGDGLIVDSAETNQPIIPAIAAPPANPLQDMVPHVGQANTYDPILKEQFIATANINWTTSQLPGTLLWSTRIHPDNSNQFVKHISQMYNAWAGSLDFRFKVAGTGFHAGAIAIVRTPPNIDPSTLKTMADVTAFEYAIVDPKQLPTVDRNVMDQRQILYHYRAALDENDINSFGGYIALFVHVQLNTSSSGANQINIQIWSRAGQDLEFSQLRPIGLASASVGIDKFNTYFPRTASSPINLTGVWMIAKPSTQATTTYNQSAAHITLDAENMSGFDKTQFVPVNRMVLDINGITGVNTTSKSATAQVNFEMWQSDGADTAWPYETSTSDAACFNVNAGGAIMATLNLSNAATAIKLYSARSTAPPSYTGRGCTGNFQNTNPGLPYQARIFAIEGSISATPIVTYQARKGAVNTFAPPLSESIVVFQNKTDSGCEFTQTLEIAAQASSGVFKGVIPFNQALIFQMIDRATSLPVAYLKMYANGVMTMKPQATQVIFNYENYQFVPLYLISATTPIPTNASLVTNSFAALSMNGDRDLQKRFASSSTSNQNFKSTFTLIPSGTCFNDTDDRPDCLG